MLFDADRLGAKAKTRAAEERLAAENLEHQKETVLASEEFTSQRELEEARALAAAKVLEASREAARLRGLLPLVQELDRRLAGGYEFVKTLDLVREKLLEGSFLGDLVERRQQVLLGIATRVLGDMTNQRFGFSSNFDVIDRLSGQPRSPRTLSGGESFLASLSLALSMVELAARAGGRLDALFLDEGFGALDNPSLDAAMDALEARALAGRLVAVISHVRAVAERITDVLAVSRDDTGATRVAWLSDAARVDLVEKDLAAAMAEILS